MSDKFNEQDITIVRECISEMMNCSEKQFEKIFEDKNNHSSLETFTLYDMFITGAIGTITANHVLTLLKTNFVSDSEEAVEWLQHLNETMKEIIKEHTGITVY